MTTTTTNNTKQKQRKITMAAGWLYTLVQDSPVKACVWHFVETKEGRFLKSQLDSEKYFTTGIFTTRILLQKRWMGGRKAEGGLKQGGVLAERKLNVLSKTCPARGNKPWWMFLNCNAAKRQFSWTIKKGGLKWALVIEARFSDCAIHPSPWSAASNSIIVWHTYLYKKL